MKLALIFSSLALCSAQAAAQAVVAAKAPAQAASAPRAAAQQAGVARLKGYDWAQRQKRTLLDKPQPLASPRPDAEPGAPAMGLCDGS
jgi:hypothetical protein